MELDNIANGDVSKNIVVPSFPARETPVDKLIRFYRARFHLFVVPITIILAIVHLKFGIQYLGQCTIQPMINIYMIVHASVIVFLDLLAFINVVNVRCFYSRCEENNNRKTMIRRFILIMTIFQAIVICFSFAWLLTGSVWIFSAKTNGVQGIDPAITNTYCQSDLYRSAFLLIIINYVTHGLMIIFIVIRRWKRRHIVQNGN